MERIYAGMVKNEINLFIKEDCPICRNKESVNYLGIILKEMEKVSAQLFVCENRNNHNRYTYFIKIKKNNYIELMNLSENKNTRDSKINTLLNKRIACPKSEEHYNTKLDHEYVYVNSLGSDKNKYYCRNHLNRSYHNRYEFKFLEEKKEYLTIENFLKNINDIYYNKLNDIYKSKIKYDLDFDKDLALESLLTIGFSDGIIASIFKVNQSTINRYKNKREVKYIKIIKIQTYQVSKKFPFHTKILVLKDEEMYKVSNYIESLYPLKGLVN